MFDSVYFFLVLYKNFKCQIKKCIIYFIIHISLCNEHIQKINAQLQNKNDFHCDFYLNGYMTKLKK